MSVLPPNGLRPGTLVEAFGLPETQEPEEPQNGLLGQLVDYDAGTGLFDVRFINGVAASLSASNVRVPKDLKTPGEGGGSESFDALIGPRLVNEVLAENMSSCLFEKGFCVLKICQSYSDCEKTIEYIRDMGNDGKLARLPEEIEEGYLGVGGRGKIAWMDPDDKDAPMDETLTRNDMNMGFLAQLLQPYSEDFCGKCLDERTPGLVSLSLTDDEEPEYPFPVADDTILGEFLSVYRRSLIKCMHFMGPGVPTVTLTKKQNDKAEKLHFTDGMVKIEATPNTIILFNTGCYDLQVDSPEETLSLSCTFVRENPQMILTEFDGDNAAAILGGVGKGPPPPAASRPMLSVMNMASRLPGSMDDPLFVDGAMAYGIDAAVEIPLMRYDVNFYYEPDQAVLQGWQQSCKHMSAIDGVELFDNKFMEIPATEAFAMGPMQRHVLEVGAINLMKYGVTKKDTNRAPRHYGICVGLDKDDFPFGTVKDKEYPGGQNVIAIIANRFSFCFNLRGPNFVADTACSASLSALHLAKHMMYDRVCDALDGFVVNGCHMSLGPGAFIGCSQSNMSSPIGRSLTFNESASGYMRGDGCSGIFIVYGNQAEKHCIARGQMVGQNGRAATLTAPNGPAQEEVILRAMKESTIQQPESALWDCHGTGTSLGDPIEVGAVRKVIIKFPRDDPLMMGTMKTYIGHLEGGAAMTSVLKACLQVVHAVSYPIAHFRVLNPHLESAEFSMFIVDCFTQQAVQTQVNNHVSSFGFGGTNAHGIFWGERLTDPPDVPTLWMKKIRQMSPPEVRVIGSSPDEWECDIPDADSKPTDKWTIAFDPDDPPDVPISWSKEDADPDDDDDNMSYSIVGNFNDWQSEMMEVGEVPCLNVAIVEVPNSGVVEFRFLKQGEPDLVMAPAFDKCNKKAAPIIGPKKDLTNSWCIRGEPGSEMKIELLVSRDLRSVMWLPVVRELEE
eukprot:gnl/TRDRNA2_/TRDRNA2_180392_c0_seq1.p1 gnl/TRDRNA2_/TRDRNA2_180392_c0~~gnl/TRDRNA2_/TRDRNA2_180392_c0_seq1.p1  ORF type:complete len:954 (-),score=214.32 gnl/TRDRNA2_/TRDRNA2_180392_c0_seq1:100-2961(-)